MPSTDPISILTADHDLVRDLFARLERDREADELLDELIEAIDQHTTLEQDVFYPAFHRAAAGGEHEHLYFEFIEEHGAVDTILAEIEPSELEPPVLRAKLKLAKELLLRHIEREENELFPLMRKLCSQAELDELGEQLEELADDGGGIRSRVSTAG